LDGDVSEAGFALPSVRIPVEIPVASRKSLPRTV